jgi:hypothetical protein
MKKFKRDLILLKRDEQRTGLSIQREIDSINVLLFQVETSPAYYTSYELIDVNRYKVLHDNETISKALKPKGLKPFQFLINRN